MWTIPIAFLLRQNHRDLKPKDRVRANEQICECNHAEAWHVKGWVNEQHRTCRFPGCKCSMFRHKDRP